MVNYLKNLGRMLLLLAAAGLFFALMQGLDKLLGRVWGGVALMGLVVLGGAALWTWIDSFLPK